MENKPVFVLSLISENEKHFIFELPQELKNILPPNAKFISIDILNPSHFMGGSNTDV